MPILATYIQPSIESPSHSNQKRKKKVIQIERKEVRLSFFADDMKFYMCSVTLVMSNSL